MSSLVLFALLIAQQADSLCTGTSPRVSPDGRWVAFQRSAIEFDIEGPRQDIAVRSEAWIRDLKSGEEKRLAKDSWISGWIDANTIVFHDGSAATVSDAPVSTKIAKPPPEIHVSNRAWAPGGGKLAYAPVFDSSGNPPRPGSDRKFYIVEGATPPNPIELGHSLFSEREGVLAWSPDGRRLVFHQVFFRPGDIPVRRIGVIDVATGAHRFVGEGHYYGNPGFNLCERRGQTPGAWDAKGERFVFITGRGGGEADVYVANGDGSEVKQLTDDEECKWSAVLEPEGRRVAFCAAKVKDGHLFDGRIRILDLFTGREIAVQPHPERPGVCLEWIKDGSGLVCEWMLPPADFRGSERERRLFKITVPKPDPLPPAAAIVSKPALTRQQRILRALASENEGIVEWAAKESQAVPDAAITAEVRKTLSRATKKGMTQAERALLFAISALDAREAAPEVMAAFESPYDANQRLALGIVAQWRLKEATDNILKVVERTPGTETNVHAAGALAWLSHDTGWKVLEQYSKSSEKDIRGAVAYSLEGLADPKAMGILISLVDDSAVLYTSYGGEIQVGDHAERALAKITGMTFDRRPIAWLSWWNKQSGKLPTVPSPNPALKKLDEEMKRCEKEWQEKMRKESGN